MSGANGDNLDCLVICNKVDRDCWRCRRCEHGRPHAPPDSDGVDCTSVEELCVRDMLTICIPVSDNDLSEGSNEAETM